MGVMMLIRRWHGVRPRVVLITCRGEESLGIRVVRNGSMECSQTMGKLGASTIGLDMLAVGIEPKFR